MNSRTCRTCHTEKPAAEFGSRRHQCLACRAKTRNVWNPDQHERERHAEQVKLNRLINSMPVPR